MSEPMAKLSEQNCDLMNGDLNRSVATNKTECIEMKSLLKSNSNNNTKNWPQKCDNNYNCSESQPKDSNIKSAHKSLTTKVSFEDQRTQLNEQTSLLDRNGINKIEENSVSGDNDQNIMEVLRLVVRTCTAPDSSKRPSASEINDLLNSYL